MKTPLNRFKMFMNYIILLELEKIIKENKYIVISPLYQKYGQKNKKKYMKIMDLLKKKTYLYIFLFSNNLKN